MNQTINPRPIGRQAKSLLLEASGEFRELNFKRTAELGMQASLLLEGRFGNPPLGQPASGSIGKLASISASLSWRVGALQIAWEGITRALIEEQKGRQTDEAWESTKFSFKRNWAVLASRLTDLAKSQEAKARQLGELAKEASGAYPKNHALAEELYRRQERVLDALSITYANLTSLCRIGPAEHLILGLMEKRMESLDRANRALSLAEAHKALSRQNKPRG